MISFFFDEHKMIIVPMTVVIGLLFGLFFFQANRSEKRFKNSSEWEEVSATVTSYRLIPNVLHSRRGPPRKIWTLSLGLDWHEDGIEDHVFHKTGVGGRKEIEAMLQPGAKVTIRRSPKSDASELVTPLELKSD